MSEILKSGAGQFLKLLVVGVMCLFLCVSFSALCTAAFTENTGYVAYGTKEDSEEREQLYTYHKESGEDTQKAEYEAQGYTVTTVGTRSNLSRTGNAVYLTFTQVFDLLLLIAILYPSLWQMGSKDGNLVRFKHKAEDKLKGLKIGLVASIPAFLLFVALVVCGLGAKPDLPISLYRFLNCPFLPLIQIIAGNGEVSELVFWQYLCLFLLLTVVPLVSLTAYWLGYRDISLSERFIYKKKKER